MGGGSMGTLLPNTPSTGLPSPSSSSSPNSNRILPVSASYSPPRRPRTSVSCSTCQEPVNGRGRAGAVESSGSSVFGPVPSQGEIERAIAALQCFLHGISSSGSNRNWVQLLGCCDPRMLISAGLGRVNYAFHLLQTDPFIKRLVISLASDRAVWEAILNNESVRKLRESLSSENGVPRISEEAGAEPNMGSDILWWFLDIVKEKISELIEKFKFLMNEIFQQRSDGMKQARAESTAQFEEQVQSSLLLAVVILLIVVLARVRGA